MKHSPAPWRISGSDRITTSNHPLRDMLLVASEVHNPADTHLIRSAPELLEACKSVLPIIQAYFEEGDFGCTEPLDLIKSAIAKAEGINKC